MIFREELARNLTRIFTPAGSISLPNDLSDNVQLVHDFLSTLPYTGVSISDNIGAADSLSIRQGIPIPEGYIGIVDELHIQTSDTASRQLNLYMHYVNQAGDFSVMLMTQASGTVANQNWPLGRRAIIPPGGGIELNTATLTAGKNLRFTYSYLLIPCGQFSPRS